MIVFIYIKLTVMEKFKNVIEFENAITKNKRIIAKKKKSVPFILLCLTMLYVVLFNLSGHNFDTFFDNQIDFIKMLSYSFIGVIFVYGIYIYYSIQKLTSQSKKWNKSLYNLSKLDERIIHNHQHPL